MTLTEQYVEKILTALVESYRASKKDSGENIIRRRTQVKPEKLYRRYTKNDGDIDQIEALNEAAGQCRALGFLSYQTQGLCSEIATLYLNDERVAEAEEYLRRHFGYRAKEDKRRGVEEILRRYEKSAAGRAPAAEALCLRLRGQLSEGKIPAACRQMEETLRALVFIEPNERMLYLREASMMIYGSSKYLEENTLESVCRELRRHLRRPCGEDEMTDEILQEYHIFREKQKLCLKGPVTIVRRRKKERTERKETEKGGSGAFSECAESAGRNQSGECGAADFGAVLERMKPAGREQSEKCGEVDFGVFPDGVEFYADDLQESDKIRVNAQRLMTVENKTSYLRCEDRNTVFFYLGGYANRAQRDFLKRIARDNPHLTFCHFGDLDAGGLYIHEHLERMTGLSFALYRMNAAELASPVHRPYLQPLTVNDRRRLQKLAEKERYRETARFMLETGSKLEQEILSWEEAEGESGAGLVSAP